MTPKNKTELVKLIRSEIKKQGWSANLNHIDVSHIDNFCYLFSEVYMLQEFNGDISRWEMSQAKNFSFMFLESHFNGDVSGWKVSNVHTMENMFMDSRFNQALESWEVDPRCNTKSMFIGSELLKSIKVDREWGQDKKEGMDFWEVRSIWRGDFLGCALKDTNEENPIKRMRL